MARYFKIFLYSLVLLNVSYIFGRSELDCSHLQDIQKQYIDKHISYSSFSRVLEKRVREQWIKSLDSNKLYFTKSDISQINYWFSRLFRDIKNEKCESFNRFYQLFYKRMKEREDFVKKEIARKNFKINQEVSLVIDSDKRQYSKNKEELDRFHKKYIQYELANIMLVEEDFEKAKENLLGIYKRAISRIRSWDPDPSPQKLEYCKNNQKSRKVSKNICKSSRWYSIYLDSFAKALDPHSSYFSKYELDDFQINMKLSLDGIGASLSSQFGYTIIERLLPGGAARNSGQLKRKDRIVAIGQKSNEMVSVFGWDLRDVVQIIRGKKGTIVYLKVLRMLKNGSQKKFLVKLTRNNIELKDHEATIIYSDKKIGNTQFVVGVIRVPSFYGGGDFNDRSISKDIKKLIRQAKKKNLAAIVVDLTRNGGGILSEAVDVAGLFIEKGNIVRQMTRNYVGYKVYHDLADQDKRIEYTGPLVVLVDRSSASASEIVAGALQDYKRAMIVGGDHTFGKGSIQSVENVQKDLGATKTTVGLYFIPGGRSTQKLGVQSDIALPSAFSIDDFGEKTLDYVLPSQHTSSFLTKNSAQSWNKVDQNLIRKIKMNSKIRINKSKKFSQIKKDLNKFNQTKKRKTHVKLKDFFAEVKEKEDKEEDEEDFFDLDIHSPQFKKKYLERSDVNEAIAIAWDMAKMDSTNNILVKKLNNK